MSGDTALPTAPDRSIEDFLVLAAQAGDRRALDLLGRRWHARLMAHAWRLTGERGLAEEAAQGAWLDIVRGLGALRDERAFPAWAYRIATRKAARQIARRSGERRRTAEIDEAWPAPATASPDRDIDHAALRRAVATLAPIHRAAVALHYFENLSVAEVAVALAIPSGTVKTRLMHARAKLRALLEGENHA